MASIWISDKTGETKLKGHLSPKGATDEFAAYLSGLKRKGYTLKHVKPLGMYCIATNRRGQNKSTLLVWVEPISPPTSKPGPGDVLVTR